MRRPSRSAARLFSNACPRFRPDTPASICPACFLSRALSATAALRPTCHGPEAADRCPDGPSSLGASTYRAAFLLTGQAWLSGQSRPWALPYLFHLCGVVARTAILATVPARRPHVLVGRDHQHNGWLAALGEILLVDRLPFACCRSERFAVRSIALGPLRRLALCLGADDGGRES